jgi:hypothetical protein
MRSALFDLRRNMTFLDLRIEVSTWALPTLYRRLDKARYAAELTSGRIFLSTLQRCRATEDLRRQDRGEGHLIEERGIVHPGLPDYRQRMVRAGYNPDTFRDLIFEDAESHSIRDAWIFCMSTVSRGEAQEKLGESLIEVHNPLEVFAIISKFLLRTNRATQCLFGPVRYTDRTFRIGELPPAPQPFIKPQSFAAEREIRFAWTHDETIEMIPQTFEIPGLSGYFRASVAGAA